MSYFSKTPFALKHPDKIFIGGQWVTPAGTAALDVISPSTEEVLARVPQASPVDMNAAVKAARQAFDDGPWPRLSAAERAPYLRRLAAAVQARGRDLAYAWSAQMGAPIDLTSAYSNSAGAMYDYYADLAERKGFADVRPREGGVGIVVREPVGVVAAIVPWNAPFSLATVKVSAALAAGCTVVLKPAPETPLDGLILAECAEDAGLPPGVLNVVPAGRDVGDHLIRNPGIDKVSFTGSTAAGRHIATVCADRVARVALELGGKSAAIILDDMPIAEVIPTLSFGCTMISGQVCAGLTRTLVSRKRRDELVEALAAAFRSIKVGDALKSGIQMGPLAMKRQLARVEGYIAKGRAEGAKIVTGGGRPKGLDRGYFIEPTIFTEVENTMTIAREEIFGPVMSIITYRDEEDAVRLANDSIYGLNGAVYTKDTDRAYAIARRIRAGNITQNGWVVDNKFPFGGFKQSGIGREQGPEGLDSFCELKTIYLPHAPAAL